MTFVSETGKIIHRLIPAICWFVLGAWLFPVLAQSADESEKKLQGSWIAAKAVRDGKAASDVVGHKLSFRWFAGAASSNVVTVSHSAATAPATLTY